MPFTSDSYITYTANHWSNTETMLEYLNHIITPYVQNKRKEVKLTSDHSALVLFDVFRGKCTEDIFKLLEDNNILYVHICPNCTDKLQLLDLSVNKPAKDFIKRKFQQWYRALICKQLEDNVEEEVDMRLSIMKPLSATWIIEMYHYFQTHPSIIINGFRSAGINI